MAAAALLLPIRVGWQRAEIRKLAWNDEQRQCEVSMREGNTSNEEILFSIAIVIRAKKQAFRVRVCV